jgi:hypothetical protein
VTLHGLHRLVLRASPLPKAETFYRELFDFDVLFREGLRDGDYGQIPPSADWDDAIAAGIEPRMSFLGRDGVALALANEDGDPEASRLDHVALAVDESDRDAIGRRAERLGCETERRSHSLFIGDRYGVEWELNASPPPPSCPFERFEV